MLQATDFVSDPPAVQAPAAPRSQGQGAREKATIWKWISVREVVFVFLTCSVGAALFRARDDVRFELSWHHVLDTSLYKNGRFPFGDEKLPPPVVTDLDSDGSPDLLLLTYNGRIVLQSLLEYRNPTEPEVQKLATTEKAVADILGLSGGGRPIAMATGFLRQYQSMLQVRQQVVVVLTSEWVVLCLDHELNLLWKSQPLQEDSQEYIIREAAIMVSPVSIQKGDVGSVIVGGRTFSKRKPLDSLKRMRRGEAPENEDELLDSLGHYNTFALEGGSGEVRWRHAPGDFVPNPAYSPSISSFHHLKLILHKRMNHEGEVSWHQYSNSIKSTLPHTWQRSSDTHFQLLHFKKDRKRSDEPTMTEHLTKVGDMAMGHMAGLAFGGLRPHSPSEHVVDPNVLVIHSVKGVDVLHLYQGRPLCSIRLSPHHASHADINGDGTIDHVNTVVNPGEAGFSEEEPLSEGDCYGQATSMALNSKPLFKHSVCKATHWSETFIATDKWLPNLNKLRRRAINQEITEPLAPVLIESSYHNVPLKLHLSGLSIRGLLWGDSGPSLPPSSHQAVTYDSVFVLSSGRLTSIGPQGDFNWQVDVRADWDDASAVIYDPEHPLLTADRPYDVLFMHGGFVPAAQSFSLQPFGKQDHVLVSGWQWVVIVRGDDGSTAATLRLPCQPVAPPVVADFSGDGWNDIITTCAEGYIGYSLTRQSGFWHSTVLALFIGLVVVVMAVYARQRNVGILPTVKAALD